MACFEDTLARRVSATTTPLMIPLEYADWSPRPVVVADNPRLDSCLRGQSVHQIVPWLPWILVEQPLVGVPLD